MPIPSMTRARRRGRADPPPDPPRPAKTSTSGGLATLRRALDGVRASGRAILAPTANLRFPPGGKSKAEAKSKAGSLHGSSAVPSTVRTSTGCNSLAESDDSDISDSDDDEIVLFVRASADDAFDPADVAFDPAYLEDGEGSSVGVPDEEASRRSELSPEDLVALEVGMNAQVYLEEWSYAYAGIFSRERFNSIPKVHRSELAVTAYLGGGNYSDVFEVSRDRGPLGRDVLALKRLHPRLRADADEFALGAEELVHETAILASLNHPHVVRLRGRSPGRLTDSFLPEDGYFVLLDRLEETLDARIGRWRGDPARHPMNARMGAARDVADAVSYLHSRGIVHRDLRPANVGFDRSGVTKLFNFGFAVALPGRGDDDDPGGTLLDVCGTPQYMAPEVGLSLGYGPPADVYSFGVLLWGMCALAEPFPSIGTYREFEERVFAGGERPPLPDRWPSFVRGLIGSCWSGDSSERPTMSDIKFLLGND